MYYIYILQSEKEGDFYTGYPEDLKNHLPVKLVYYEACLNQ